MAGNAAGSFPCGLAPEDGLPVGFQVMAPAMADDRVYRVGAALERMLSDQWGGLAVDRLADSTAGAYLGVAREGVR
jgi:aspartyl-tRNA(Asn)/glutamyl-tRNA(Gln) amidotransferase subunit A